MDSEEAAIGLSGPFAWAAFLGRFAPNATFKSHMYSLVIQFIPLHFKPNDNNELRALEELNRLPLNAFHQVCWIKPPYRRVAAQTCKHVLAVMTEDTNKILTDSLIICQKRVYAEKCKKEPTHCLKCHGWGHMSYDCQQPYSVCGTCAGRHWTPECNNQGRPHCTSCHVDGHPSWDQRCSVFLSKCHNMDMRLTENQMPYYPTADPWTHALHLPKLVPIAPEPSQMQSQLQPRSRATGANRPTANSQLQPYRQTTLNFTPSQDASQQHSRPSCVGPWRDEADSELEGPPPPHLV